ncbi:MAG: hypothetical protein JWO58_1786 [Chitinophagaceae bacterium]|nr:hypothetical protein [Chitinophagaceae bacterium]
MNSSFQRIGFLWLPVFDKYRYRPFGIQIEFLQNVFELVFLLVFIWFWSWGPLLVILYYMVEALVMSAFTSFKLWKNDTVSFPFSTISSHTFKIACIAIGSSVVVFFSYGITEASYQVLGTFMKLPSLLDILKDDQNFLFGVFAIIAQQTMEYIKQKRMVINGDYEWTVTILTPVFRVFIQQFATVIGILSVLFFPIVDVRIATIMIALILGAIKIGAGQLYIIPKEK